MQIDVFSTELMGRRVPWRRVCRKIQFRLEVEQVPFIEG